MTSRVEALIAKLQALATDHAATPAEAAAAAAKIRDLADRYGLDTADIGIEEVVQSVGRKRYRPMDALWPGIAEWSRCAFHFREGATLHAVYTGRPHHVALAVWAHQYFVRAVKTSLDAYKTDRSYRRRVPHRRRIAAAAFVEQMVFALCCKLQSDGPADAGPLILAAEAARNRRNPGMAQAGPLPQVKGLTGKDSAWKAGYQAGYATPLSTPIGGNADANPLLLG